MKTFTPLIALVVMVFLAVPALGGDEAYSLKAYYEAAIDKEMTQCRQMASLLTSRSPNLRMKGHREASMAMYLETHRDELVTDMMRLNLEPKTYKVERYLNDRFSCSCYADWATK
jgi:hypothetical protein